MKYLIPFVIAISVCLNGCAYMYFVQKPDIKQISIRCSQPDIYVTVNNINYKCPQNEKLNVDVPLSPKSMAINISAEKEGFEPFFKRVEIYYKVFGGWTPEQTDFDILLLPKKTNH